MPKFFVSSHQIINETVTIIGEDVNHIVNVLRKQKEDEVFVCDKDENITYRTEIVEILKEKIVCKILNQEETVVESKIDVTIFQGLPKADKMEYIIQKTTELGVKTIIPVAMKRCIVKLEGKDQIKKINRWQKIAEVAAKQSGRDVIPKIGNVINIEKVKECIKKFDLFLVAYENEKLNTLKNELQRIHLKSSLKIGVMIGPEGGLEEREIETLKQDGAKIITLGNRILRTETAPVAILSNIMYEYDG